MKSVPMLGMCLALSGCAGLAAAFVPLAALDQEGQERFLREQDEKLHAALDICRYDAVETRKTTFLGYDWGETETGKVLCRAGDCKCHEELVRKTLSKGHVPQ